MHPLEELLKYPKESWVVGYLATAPSRAHSKTELAKKLKLKPQVVTEVCKNLAEKGWIKFVNADTTEALYAYNLKYQPAKELRAGLLKGKATPEDDLILGIKKLGKIKAAFLSGIFTGQKNAPVDLLLVGKDIKEADLQKFLKGCIEMFGKDLNYTIFSEEEFKERQEFFDKFLREIFENPHLKVVDKL
jgi:DNA-binding Lrp family transcriptional regulator